MSVSVEKYINKVYEIYEEKPSYKTGHDGSDGLCDCIGMCKGALRRNGVEPKGLGGTNYAARFTLKKTLKKFSSAKELKLGEVVLRGRPYDPNDKYPLPSKYLPGGASYTGDTTNYVHIGTVTRLNPLEITHMTSPTAKKDTKIGTWNYHAELPGVNYEKTGSANGTTGNTSNTQQGPFSGQNPDNLSGNKTGKGDTKMTATVYSANGGDVNYRTKPSTSAPLVDRIPCNATVTVLDAGAEWSSITYKGKSGYIMSSFLRFNDDEKPAEDKGSATVTVDRNQLMEVYSKLQSAYDTLGDFLGLRG